MSESEVGEARRSVARWILGVGFALALGGTAYMVYLHEPHPSGGGVMPFAEMTELFEREGGWTVLWMPDSKYEPGAIIEVVPGGGIRFVSHLSECGFPEGTLAPRVGQRPGIAMGRELGFDAEMLATIPGVRLGPEGRRAVRVGLEIESMTAEALDLIRLEEWRTFHEDSISGACRRQLDREGVFVVGEAARVQEANYAFYDEAGARIRLDADGLDEVMELGTGIESSLTADNRVRIRVPMTVAFRQIRALPTGFHVLGPDDAEEDADALPDADSIVAAAIRASVPEDPM